MLNKYYKSRVERTLGDSPIISIRKDIAYCKAAIGICKIETVCYYEDNLGKRHLNDLRNGKGTGFLIKFKNPKNCDQYKYFLMTCEHVIQKEIM